ncbi:MAG: hypothetical protein M3Z66_14375 [Chloroflexota bacterium]|nr:hypothetical protein [Chloroflexota bacterium]
MPQEYNKDGPPPDADRTLTPEQLRGLQYGVAATLMPVGDCWRLHYFSIPHFEEALHAVVEVLPAVNSNEERARARNELRDHLRNSNHPTDSG